MNIETANAIRDRIRQAPQEIRVLCPRGHFIAHVTLVVPGAMYADASAAPIWMQPRGLHKQHISDPPGAGRHGFRAARNPRSWQSLNVRLKCTNSRCRYSGSFAMIPLAVDLATAALAGHAEYRMTA